MEKLKKFIIILIAVALIITALFVAGKKEDGSHKISCTFSVNCQALLFDLTKLDKIKHSLVPQNGFFIDKKTVLVDEGENALDLLVSEAKDKKLHVDFSSSPSGGAAYIRGIGNIYEKDAGELSGWIYKVNNESPSVGAGEYIIKDGDYIEWIYSTDLLKDMM